jgi:hypothetical protein
MGDLGCGLGENDEVWRMALSKGVGRIRLPRRLVIADELGADGPCNRLTKAG